MARGLCAGTLSVHYDPHEKRDPFIPLVSLRSASVPGELLAVEKPEDVRVEGVVYDPRQGSIVILNATVLKEGQEIGNVKVLKIDSGGVQLVVNGTECYKPLYDESKVRHA